MSQQLNEGLIDRFFQGIFKLLFKGQMKQAGDLMSKVHNNLSPEQKKHLQTKFKNMNDNVDKFIKLLEEQ